MEESKRLGVPGICITEHNSLWDRHEFAAFARKHDMLLIRGVEVDTEMGHVLVFGMEDYVSGISRIAEAAAGGRRGERVHDYSPPLPRHSQPRRLREALPVPRRTPDLPDTVEEASQHAVFGLADAVEVANGNTIDSENAFAHGVAERLGMKGTGGSDAHSVHGLGSLFHRLRG